MIGFVRALVCTCIVNYVKEAVYFLMFECPACTVHCFKEVLHYVCRREMMIKDLMNSFDVYEDLLAKSQKGQEFYRKLESNVSKLLTRCQGLCKIQAEEREQIMNRHKPKGTCTSCYTQY